MITSPQRKSLVAIIGSKHLSKIQAHLKATGVINKNGNPYTDHYISRVFNGKVAVQHIEDGIWDFVRAMPGKLKEDQAEKDRLISAALEFSTDQLPQ
jgi:hypothetical protein